MVTLCQSEGTQQIIMSFPPSVVRCLLKKGLQRLGWVLRASQEPLATLLVLQTPACSQPTVAAQRFISSSTKTSQYSFVKSKVMRIISDKVVLYWDQPFHSTATSLC